MIVTNDLDIKIYDYIYLWWKIIESVASDIKSPYHFNLCFTPGQAVFGRDMLFNLMSLVYWRVVTARKQRKIYIGSSHGNTRQVRHECIVGDLVYVDKMGIYHNTQNKNNEPYRITKFKKMAQYESRGALQTNE